MIKMSPGTLHQILASANGFVNALIYGSQLGWTAPTLVKLAKTDFGVSSEELSWIASSYEMGRFVGPILVAIFLDIIGRKLLLTINSLANFILLLAMIFARTVVQICCLRALLGLFQGVNTITISIYLAENCTPTMRGIMGSIVPICVNVAFLMETVLVTYAPNGTAAIVNATIGFCSFLTSLYLMETPYFLAMKERDETAKKNLMWLRGKSDFDDDLELELSHISENIKLEKLKNKSLVSVFANADNCKFLLITVTSYCLLIMTGFVAVSAYSPMIFRPTSTFSSSDFTVAFGFVPLIVCCILPCIVERYNRRTLLLGLSFTIAIIHACTFFLFSMEGTIDKAYFPWLIFVAMAALFGMVTLIIPVIYIIVGELLPMSIKAIGSSLCATMSSLTASILLRMFLPISEAYGIQYNFIVYSTACILMFLFVFIVLPETRGKSLVDIQRGQ